jgi:hypothetical protein
MKQDDLTRIKHVGLSRMRLFNDVRITTIKQLSEMPLEKLAAIKSIGDHYAKLIKNSVNDYYEEQKKILPLEDASAKEIKPTRVNRDLQKKIKRLNKNLYRVNEQLKPLWKKKYLTLFIEFRKRSTKLKSRLEALNKIHQDIPEKVKKRLIKKADQLIINLKQVGKKPKKKKYKKITIEIRSFSSLLRDIIH